MGIWLFLPHKQLFSIFGMTRLFLQCSHWLCVLSEPCGGTSQAPTSNLGSGKPLRGAHLAAQNRYGFGQSMADVEPISAYSGPEALIIGLDRLVPPSKLLPIFT